MPLKACSIPQEFPIMPMSSDGQPQPLLSIIIPAYNEERRLPGSLQKIDPFLADTILRGRD